jgi:cell division protein FtsI/penicillin-binding protein 2
MSFDTAAALLWHPRGPGVEIRRELERIDARNTLLAFRTGSDAGPFCASTTDSQAKHLDPPCLPAWSLTLPGPKQPTEIDEILAQNQKITAPRDKFLLELSAEEPDLNVFSAMALASSDGFSQWHSISGVDLGENRALVLRHRSGTITQGAAKRITVSLIGELDLEASSGTDFVSRRSYCLDRGSLQPRLTEACGPTRPAIAHVITYDTRFLTEQTELVVRPTRIHLAHEPGFDAENDNDVRVSSRIRLRCMGTGFQPDGITCTPRWIPSSREVRLAADLRRVGGLQSAETNNDNDTGNVDPDTNGDPSDVETFAELNFKGLIRRKGDLGLAITQKARNLGLEQALGSNSQQFGKPLTYLANLPRQRRLEDFRISIDPELQALVRAELAKVVQAPGRSLSDGSNIPEEWDYRRRAAFVLIDLQAPEGAGAIRAAAGFPAPPISASDWDIRAIQLTNPNASPLTAVPWEGVDGRMTPGSVMKILSAVSLIQTATGVTDGVPSAQRENVADAILGMTNEGYTSRITLPRRTPLDLGDNRLTIPDTIVVNSAGDGGIQDFTGFTPFATAKSRRLLGCGTSPDTPDEIYRYGLCEALAVSSNIWFGAMALHQDQQGLSKLASGVEPANHAMTQAQQLERMGLHRNFSILRKGDAQNLDDPLLPRGTRVLTELHPRLASGDYSGPAEKFDTERFGASTAFGQNMQASPLAVAAISASVATDQIVQPYLFYDASRVAAPAEPLFSSPAARPLVRRLHDGLRAVVQSPGGTAYNPFHAEGSPGVAVANRVYGKTGTAQIRDLQIRDALMDGSWFTGWINDPTDVDGPRYAFACAITHLTKANSLCAHFTAALLPQIEGLTQ